MLLIKLVKIKITALDVITICEKSEGNYCV